MFLDKEVCRWWEVGWGASTEIKFLPDKTIVTQRWDKTHWWWSVGWENQIMLFFVWFGFGFWRFLHSAAALMQVSPAGKCCFLQTHTHTQTHTPKLTQCILWQRTLVSNLVRSIHFDLTYFCQNRRREAREGMLAFHRNSFGFFSSIFPQTEGKRVDDGPHLQQENCTLHVWVLFISPNVNYW